MFWWLIFGAVLAVVLLLVRLRELYRREKQLSRLDPKTGALSERGFIEVLKDESKRARRHLSPLTVAYIDLDNFKPVNDLLGYSAGDAVLRVVARTMQTTLREVDVVARRQGDEFALLLPETGANDAPLVLEKLRKTLGEAMAANKWPVTFSMGAVTLNQPLDTAEAMIEAASNVMHEAKRKGKNRIEHLLYEMRDAAEHLVACSNCSTSFSAISNASCPRCGKVALSNLQTEVADVVDPRRSQVGAGRQGMAVRGCVFRLPLEGGKIIEVYGPADITLEETEAIVNPTNSSLRDGGDLERAIRYAGGPAIGAECKQIVANVGRLANGKAVITTGGKLPAKYVVHTVVPHYHDGDRGEAALLANCYRESMRVAENHAIRSLAFPSLCTGGGGYLVTEAARIAVSTVVDELGSTRHVQLVRFVLFDAPNLRAFTAACEGFAPLDAVTGLPNSRRLFTDLDRALRNPEQGVALLLVDVDEFEKISAEYGRSVTANVLRSVGQMLLKEHSQRAAAYRWGGDEFAAILVGASRADALNLAESIRTDVSGLSVEGHPELRITARVGVACTPDDGYTRDQLMQSADDAAYQAMREGGNCVRDHDAKTAKTA